MLFLQFRFEQIQFGQKKYKNKMYSLYIKEIKVFLHSIIGYIVMGVFLSLTGLFLWVFPMSYNILDRGYADLGSFFGLAPIVFLLLKPAITMRKKSRHHGTFADNAIGQPADCFGQISGGRNPVVHRPASDIDLCFFH